MKLLPTIAMTTVSTLAFAAAPAYAGAWSIAPRASVAAGYEQNSELSVTQDTADANGVVLVGARIVRHDDTVNWLLDPQVSLVRYQNQHRLNRDDINITGAMHKYFERGDWATTAIYTRDTTVLSERGTSGLTESNLPHEQIALSTHPTWRFSQRWQAAVTAAWAADDYATTPATGLVDYDYASIAGQLGYALTERTELTMDASAGRISIQDLQRSTDQVGANFGVRVAVDELWQLSLGAGPLRVSSDEAANSGFSYSAKLQRKSLTSSFNLEVSNSATPDGRGVLTRRKRATLAFSRNLSSRLAADCNAQWTRNRAALPAKGLEFSAVNYESVSAALRWQAAPTVSLSLSLAWLQQEQVLTGAAQADSYRAALSISWQGLARVH